MIPLYFQRSVILYNPILNNGLRKIREWAEQYKMLFNPDPTKQDQEVLFLRKSISTKHPDLDFNSLVVEKVK